MDAAILRTALRAELFELDQIRSAEWDPMHHNPGNGLYALVSRDFAPLEERLRHLTQRLRAVPAYLGCRPRTIGRDVGHSSGHRPGSTRRHTTAP